MQRCDVAPAHLRDEKTGTQKPCLVPRGGFSMVAEPEVSFTSVCIASIRVARGDQRKVESLAWRSW